MAGPDLVVKQSQKGCCALGVDTSEIRLSFGSALFCILTLWKTFQPVLEHSPLSTVGHFTCGMSCICSVLTSASPQVSEDASRI